MPEHETGKGDADTRTPDFKKRRENYEEIDFSDIREEEDKTNEKV